MCAASPADDNGDCRGRRPIRRVRRGLGQQGRQLADASRALGRAYPTGSALFAVSADTYFLDEQPDGSSTLVKETAAGAIQPVVDFVAELDLAGAYRTGQLTRVDLFVRFAGRSAQSNRRVTDRSRRLSVSLRNPS